MINEMVSSFCFIVLNISSVKIQSEFSNKKDKFWACKNKFLVSTYLYDDAYQIKKKADL